jgi:hypothetical protein
MDLLLRVQQGIELCQIRRRHDDRRRGRQRRARLGQGDHRRGGQRDRVREQDPQRIVNRDFAVMGRVPEDRQILLRAQPVVAAVAEPIVGEAESGRREQVLAIDVVGERARLAHQLVDDVPIMDGVLVATDQPRPRLHVVVGVPDLDAVGEQPGFDPFADQPAMDRIGVALDVNQAAGVDAAADLQATVDPRIGQFAEPGQFLGEAVATAGVATLHHVLEEGRVLGAAGEVAAAAQEQRLIDGGLEVPVRRLSVAVLVRLADVDPLARHAVVRQ